MIDASQHLIAATLSQTGRPLYFLQGCWQIANLITQQMKTITHYLIGKPFQLVTDQRSVSFMFDNKVTSEIKNEKIQRWRLELEVVETI